MSTTTIAPSFTRTLRTTIPAQRRPVRSVQTVQPARPVRPARPVAPRTAPTPKSVVAAPAALRLTRRGRLVLLSLFVLGIFVLVTAFGGQSAATGEKGTPVPTRTIVVGTGDTLWEIAGEVAGPGEVTAMVQRIEELNALPSASLQAGQRLAVPVG